MAQLSPDVEDSIESSEIATQLNSTPGILLERMPQQAGLLGDDVDWTGSSSPAVRRKLQNRINQRERRTSIDSRA
jgi:hypothetical protein